MSNSGRPPGLGHWKDYIPKVTRDTPPDATPSYRPGVKRRADEIEEIYKGERYD